MPFNKLQNSNYNIYNITHRKNFQGTLNLNDRVEDVFEFAYGMTFGREGTHREHRTGGQIRRKNGEVFINTFQGKLAEFGLYKFFTNNGFILNTPDLGMWAEGIWDDVDLIINNKKINVKSAASFSNLLLLETRDWDANGIYIPNIDIGGGQYDFFILTRINPDGKSIMTRERLLYSNEVEKGRLKNLMVNNNWSFDIVGFITLSELRNLIEQGFILPQNSLLNGKTKMDAENYYCQAGDMQPIENILPLLNE